MAIEIDGKVYRNLQEQVEENLDDITEIKEDLLVDEAAITSLQTGKANVSDVYNKTAIDGIVEDLEDDIDTKANISDLATVATTGSYNDLTNKPSIPVVPTNVSAFTNDAGYITSSALTGYALESDTLIKDLDGNIDETIYVTNISSDQGEDTDNKATIGLSSGIRSASLTLYAGGEESDATISLRGTTSIGSEGTIQISGETTFFTENRITVDDGNNNTESIAYLSDIPATALYQHKYKFNYADSTDNVYFKFEIAFISSRSTVYTTIADIFTYLLAHNSNGDIVGRTYGYDTVLPTGWAFGGEIEADVTTTALQFTVRDDTLQPLTYEVYSNTSGLSLIASSCYLIN